MQAHIPIAFSRIIITLRNAHPVVEKEGKEGVFFFKAQFNRGAHTPARLLFTHTRSAPTVRCKHEASIAWLKTLGRHEKWYSLVVVQFLEKTKKEFTIDTHSPNFCHLLFEAVYCREHCGCKPARHHLRGFRVYSRCCRICHPRKRQGS